MLVATTCTVWPETSRGRGMTEGRHRPEEDMSRSKLSSGALCALLCTASAWADEIPPPTPKYGISIGAFVSTFFGESQSGPQTPLSNTTYSDTFNTGGGFRIEGYRDFDAGWRGQVGLVHSQWSGKYFVGGEFPAGAQFGDFSLSGVYVGGRYSWALASDWTPYVVGNLGIVNLSSLTVETGGTTIPYWSGNVRDYLELGAGVAWKLGHRQALTADLRLQAFGAPQSASYPVAEATGGTALLINVGYEWGFR